MKETKRKNKEKKEREERRKKEAQEKREKAEEKKREHWQRVIDGLNQNSSKELKKWINQRERVKILDKTKITNMSKNDRTLEIICLLSYFKWFNEERLDLGPEFPADKDTFMNYENIFELSCFIFDQFSDYFDILNFTLKRKYKDIYGNYIEECVDKLKIEKSEFLKINRKGFDVDNLRTLFSVLEINNINARETIPQSVKDAVWRRDKGRCSECGSNELLEFDHIIPVSKGGSNTARNIQLLCQNCNRKKHNKL